MSQQPNTCMIFCGVDPGTRATGYGFIQRTDKSFTALDYGCIHPPTDLSLQERLLIIYESLEVLIDRYCPTFLATETQFCGVNFQSTLKLGQVRGIIGLLAMKKKLAYAEYPPARIKRAICGNGRGSKPQIQLMTATLLHLPAPPQPEDAADALATALCHAHCMLCFNTSSSLR